MIYEWQIVLMFGFLSGVAATLASQKLFGQARKWLRILPLLALVSTQGCAAITPLAVILRTAGAAAETGHAINQAKKAIDRVLAGEEEELTDQEKARRRYDADYAKARAMGMM